MYSCRSMFIVWGRALISEVRILTISIPSWPIHTSVVQKLKRKTKKMQKMDKNHDTYYDSVKLFLEHKRQIGAKKMSPRSKLHGSNLAILFQKLLNLLYHILYVMFQLPSHQIILFLLPVKCQYQHALVKIQHCGEAKDANTKKTWTTDLQLF